MVELATTGLDPWVSTTAMVRAAVTATETVSVPVTDTWRLSYLSRLLEERQQLYYSGKDKDVEYIQELIESLCVN